MKKHSKLIVSAVTAVFAALTLTACSGGAPSDSSAVMPWDIRTSTTQPSTIEQSPFEQSDTEPSYFEPSTIIQPSTVEPSTVQPSTVTPSGKRTIREALEADIGVQSLAESFTQQMGIAGATVVGSYLNDNAILFNINLGQYLDPTSEQLRNALSTLAAQFESISSQMASTISLIEQQYNVFPFTMEFRICNGDGSVLYTRTYSNQG